MNDELYLLTKDPNATELEVSEGWKRNNRPIEIDGPWSEEPDKVAWTDPDTGYECLVIRNHFGALCGYVAIPPPHPFHGSDYAACTAKVCAGTYCEHSIDLQVQVHGGVTYAGPNQPDGIGTGRSEDAWWFGFDCNHAWDLAPALMGGPFFRSGEETYRDLTFVIHEVRSFARQLKEKA